MQQRFVISGWRQLQSGDQIENVPGVCWDYQFEGVSVRDVTKQPGVEIVDGDLGVFLVTAPEKIIKQIEADPLYKVLPVDGKLTKEERNDLKRSKHLADEVDKLGPEATRLDFVRGLTTTFREQGKHRKQVQ